MAGNDWINSYLEAILDAGGAAGEISAAAGGGGGIEGASGEKRDKSSLMLRERGRFSPARYFVEEVISSFDETDLYKTWVRVSPFTACRCRLQLMSIPRFLGAILFLV
jgi:sucrose-phosphate synthase